jgi:UDP-N-acetylmuramoyl-tripeptide--D-alanyl-D-alanine ligase
MENALAAVAVAGILSVPLEQVVSGLESVVAEDHRMVVHQLASGSLLIDDCYNANPTSVTAALRTVASLGVDHKIAVLGEMAEVDEPEIAHRQIVTMAEELGIEVVAIDTDLYGLESVSDVPEFVGTALCEGNTAVLVKGSRVAGLERIVDELLES